MKKPIGRPRPKKALSWICIVIGIMALAGAAALVVRSSGQPAITSAPQAALTTAPQ
jgi:uncharacterized protein YpmB